MKEAGTERVGLFLIWSIGAEFMLRVKKRLYVLKRNLDVVVLVNSAEFGKIHAGRSRPRLRKHVERSKAGKIC